MHRRAILLDCHQLMGPPRQAAPDVSLLPPATSIEHDVRMFSTLAAQALRANQFPGTFFFFVTHHRRLIENSILSCPVLFIPTVLFLFSCVTEHFPFSFLEILSRCSFFFVIFSFCSLVGVRAALCCTHNVARFLPFIFSRVTR